MSNAAAFGPHGANRPHNKAVALILFKAGEWTFMQCKNNQF